MRHHTFSLLTAVFLGALVTLAVRAQDPAPAPPINTDDTPVPEWQMAFENLDEEKQSEYRDLIFEATRLFNQKRVIEALNQIAEAEKIFAEGPMSYNLRGACYVEFRNFQRARAAFEKALKLQSVFLEGAEGVIGEARRKRMRPVVNILFNIAEMDFVTGKWQACHDRIEQIMPMLEIKNVAMSRLVEFKYLLCKLKLGQVEEARKLADKYDYLDDNPYHYYAKSALAYYDKDIEAAEGWRASASRIFRRAAVLAPWEDTMIEFGYVKSFYGGDLEGE